MEEKGTVTEVSGNIAKVEVDKKQACEACTASSFCNATGERSNIIDATNEIGAQTGQKVIIEFVPGSIIKGSFLVYIVPIIMLVLFSSVAQLVTKKEIFSIIWGVLGIVISFVIIRSVDKTKKIKLIPRVKEII